VLCQERAERLRGIGSNPHPSFSILAGISDRRAGRYRYHWCATGRQGVDVDDLPSAIHLDAVLPVR
jgi:hypothetical protein